MNKIDWVFWILICGIIMGFIVLAISGCAALQHRDTPTVAPAPGVQLWQTVKKSNWLVTLAIPIIALGAVAMFNGAAKLGMSAVIFGCVNLFMALATARFALWMSVFGLIGSVAVVAASILARKKALVEIIKGVQDYRDNKVNGANLDMRLTEAQKSKSTQKIVQNIKANLKVKGEIE